MSVLLLLFAGSGFAALIYEVVWLQLLELVVGASAASIAILLGTWMGGMCLGSLLLPRFARNRPALRVYAVLELGTGLSGIAVLYFLPLIESLYVGAAGGASGGLVLRAAVSAVCLLPPTMLMGATLPAIAGAVDASLLGYFYGANIAGGVAGCLAAGFWLLPDYDMNVAGTVAVGVNFLVAMIALAMPSPPLPGADRTGTSVAPTERAPYVAIAISGVCALGAEVVWTRLLSLTLGPTVYTFSIILAVFLAGLGLGSAFGSRVAGRPRSLLALCQLLQMAAIAWAAFMIAARLPWWYKDLSVQADPWRGFTFDLFCCAVAILPAAVLWGASFPLALRTAFAGCGQYRRTTAQIYAANTAGAIAGALLFSLVVVPWLASQGAERLLIALAGIAGCMVAAFRLRAAALVAGALLIWSVPATPWKLIAFGRRLPMENGPWRNLYTTEGVNSSIAYSEWVDKRRFFHVAGKVEASSTPADMRLQRMLGHIPALLHPDPRSVLIVGCGAGVTAGTFVVHPEVRRITLCEIEPRIPPASARFFAKENHGVVTDPRTHIVFDDARHFVRTTAEKFDIITSDPIHPWVKGAATLYSKEYFEFCRAHLKPGGMVTQWVPLYDSDPATVQSEIATFFAVFPNAVVWGNVDDFDQGYDVVLMGWAGPAPVRIDADAVQRRFHASPALEASLREVGFASSSDLLGMYTSRPGDLRDWLRGAQINWDRSLRLQYLAGMSLNRSFAPAIYGQMQQRSAFPEDLFTGDPAALRAIRKVFEDWRRNPF